jgi:hypothetical protein
MRYFMKSTSPFYIAAFKEIRAMASERHRFYKAKAAEWGFDEIACTDFRSPAYFFKRADDPTAHIGPTIEGFKGGQSVKDPKGTYFRYSFHGRNKRASELMKQLKDAPALPPELQGDNHWRRKDISAVFCARFGLPDGVFQSNHISFGVIYLLNDDLLACSLPYRNDTSKEAAPAVFPEGFEEITERALHAEIDRHNQAIEVAAA